MYQRKDTPFKRIELVPVGEVLIKIGRALNFEKVSYDVGAMRRCAILLPLKKSLTRPMTYFWSDPIAHYEHVFV